MGADAETGEPNYWLMGKPRKAKDVVTTIQAQKIHFNDLSFNALGIEVDNIQTAKTIASTMRKHVIEEVIKRQKEGNWVDNKRESDKPIPQTQEAIEAENARQTENME